MLTTRGLVLLIAALVAWGVGRLLGVDELYVVAISCVAVVVFGTVATWAVGARIAVRRLGGQVYVHQGQVVEIRLQLRNDGKVPAPLLLVEDRRPTALESADGPPRFVVAGLAPHAIVSFAHRSVGHRRGRYTVGPLRIRVRDPFGVAERVRRYRSTDEVVVFPRIETLRPIPGWGAQRGSTASDLRRLIHAGDEFYTMREYTTGDDLRRVHWPSTAHRQKLMVRQHEQPWNASATVLLDSRARSHGGVGESSTFERAVSATASVLTHLHGLRYELRLVTEPSVPNTLPGTLIPELVHLAELRPSPDPRILPLLTQLRDVPGGLLVIVITTPASEILSQDAEILGLLQAGYAFTGRLALIIERVDSEAGRGLTRLLRSAGWRAAQVLPGEQLGDSWRRATLSASGRRAHAYSSGRRP